jgi:hypothetical protein
MSQSNVSLVVGQISTVTLYGNGNYYLSSNTGPSVASVTISGPSAIVSGLSSGSTNAAICESGGSCATLVVTVNNTAAQTSPAPTAIVTNPPTSTFTKYLAPGSGNAQVTVLQQALAAQGYFSGAVTGYYGAQTKAAVIKFQTAHSINPLGVVGPATRTALNQLGSTSVPNTNNISNVDITTMTLSQLQAEVQSLESQLTQVLNRITQLTGQQHDAYIFRVVQYSTQ